MTSLVTYTQIQHAYCALMLYVHHLVADCVCVTEQTVEKVYQIIIIITF